MESKLENFLSIPFHTHKNWRLRSIGFRFIPKNSNHSFRGIYFYRSIEYMNKNGLPIGTGMSWMPMNILNSVLFLKTIVPFSNKPLGVVIDSWARKNELTVKIEIVGIETLMDSSTKIQREFYYEDFEQKRVIANTIEILTEEMLNRLP